MISVALCTHNGEKYLAQQLESMLNQTLPPSEIVLSDDASSDNTVALAEALVADHPGTTTLRVIRNAQPLGVTKNFEQAVLATTGDLIALSDQDDVWRPNRLERIAAEFDSRPGLVLLHGEAELVDANGDHMGVRLFDALDTSAWELATIRSGHAFDALVRRNLALGASTVFRRTLLDVAIPFSPNWVHDEWLAIIAAACGDGTVDYLDEPLLDYRQHGANQIGVQKLSLRGKLRRLMEPRRERNARLVRAFDDLTERLAGLPVAPGIAAKAREKAKHERVRDNYPGARYRRVVPVVRELLTGRYALSGRGLPDVLRDLIQPVG